MKTIGVIGGLGPEATADFYIELNKVALECGLKERPPCLIFNVPINLNMEHQMLLGNKSIEEYLPYMIEAARKLEKAGASFIVIPCNTIHILLNKIRIKVSIPVVSIIDSVVETLSYHNITNLLVLSTAQTAKSMLYSNSFDRHKIPYTILDNNDQKDLNRIIANLVSMNKIAEDKNLFFNMIDKYKNSNVLLACSDLGYFKDSLTNHTVFDSIGVLARKCINEIKEGNLYEN